MKITVKMVKRYRDYIVEKDYAICARILREWFDVPKCARKIEFVISDKPMPNAYEVKLRSPLLYSEWYIRIPGDARAVEVNSYINGVQAFRTACKKVGINPRTQYAYVRVYYYY